ncbi:ferritin family protein [Desulfuromonas sp. KJ2020]|uniref:ferritin-like domain-containing protein n=1 Tax=Desulfuromonas sp. KJ2020 TaxID=2919173 RepID=UPI0020A7B4EA|nr:ferritin family protein [Desulfuromonas sp. KJ2020]MCP3177628.1 ferritin family protein [Desulfuromonas sp. KJ2020]
MTGLEEFSGFEVIRAAMEVEKQGHRFYSTMSAKAKSPLAKEIFTWLAQDEVGHLKTLEDLAPKYEDGAFWESEEVFLPYLRRFSASEIFPSPARLEEVLKKDDSDLEALDLAIEAEERFAEYFHKAATQARTEDGKEAFTWLAAEEDRHARVLKERKAKILGQ